MKTETKELIDEAKETIREAKIIILELMEEPMNMEQKEKIMKLYRLLK